MILWTKSNLLLYFYKETFLLEGTKERVQGWGLAVHDLKSIPDTTSAPPSTSRKNPLGKESEWFPTLKFWGKKDIRNVTHGAGVMAQR